MIRFIHAAAVHNDSPPKGLEAHDGPPVDVLRRNATGDAACRGAVDLAHRIAPLAHGEVAALTMAFMDPASAHPMVGASGARGSSSNVFSNVQR